MKKLALTLALFAACTAPPAHETPRPQHVIRVSVEDGADLTGWMNWHRKALLKLWPRLDATGYAFVLDDRAPDVRVRTFDAGSGCAHGGGRYELGRPFVEIDPVCVHGAEELRFAVAHEVLHWLTWRDARWVGHLCVRDEAPDCHPTVHGTGLLSPVLPADHDANGEPVSAPLAVLSNDDLRLLRALRITR